MNRALVPLLAGLIFIFYFLQFAGAGLDYWDTYIVAPATFIAGRPGVFVDEQGQPRYGYHLRGSLPRDLIDRAAYNIVSKDQRIGAGVTFAAPYRVFGMLGFRLFYAAFGALAFLLSVMAGRLLFDREAWAVMLGLLVAVNPFMLLMDRLNANFISVPILIGLLALLLAERPRWGIIGLVYGALGGIRNEAIVLAPALLVLLLATRESRRGLPFFTAGALASIAPYLAWNRYAFGRMLIHASQFADFDGWRPVFPHRFFGWRFDLNGLFNWPFYDHLVRTPHYPFPTYLTLPLTLVLCFGTVLTAFFLTGLWAQWRRDRRWWAFHALWLFFALGLFLFQENWEEPKTTFGALAIVPLAVLMTRGLEWLGEHRRSGRHWLAVALLTIALTGLVRLAAGMQTPVDERWYVRFPKAKIEAAQIGCLADEQRREWMFFHTDECPAELREQRAKLTRGNPLPRLYYPVRLRWPDLAAEWGHYEPPIFDVWDRIYGY
ncbi:MAG: hypothetical protein GX444_10150 [Myxococcales bacterium]|nr:hypothetical protein [Myxococcales bacterium]